jgi:hypothetical protein
MTNAGQTASGDYAVTARLGDCVSPSATTAIMVNPPVSLAVQALTSGLVLDWIYGTLQSATNIASPWNDLMFATFALHEYAWPAAAVLRDQVAVVMVVDQGRR